MKSEHKQLSVDHLPFGIFRRQWLVLCCGFCLQ